MPPSVEPDIWHVPPHPFSGNAANFPKEAPVNWAMLLLCKHAFGGCESVRTFVKERCRDDVANLEPSSAACRG